MVSLALTAVELEHCWRWWGMRMCSCRGWQWFTADEWFWWKFGCRVAMMMYCEWFSMITQASLLPTTWHWKQTSSHELWTSSSKQNLQCIFSFKYFNTYHKDRWTSSDCTINFFTAEHYYSCTVSGMCILLTACRVTFPYWWVLEFESPAHKKMWYPYSLWSIHKLNFQYHRFSLS